MRSGSPEGTAIMPNEAAAPPKRRRWKWALLIAIILLIAGAWIAYRVSWRNIVESWPTDMYARAASFYLESRGDLPESIEELESESEKLGLYELPVSGYARPIYRPPACTYHSEPVIFIQPPARDEWYIYKRRVITLDPDGQTLHHHTVPKWDIEHLFANPPSHAPPASRPETTPSPP